MNRSSRPRLLLFAAWLLAGLAGAAPALVAQGPGERLDLLDGGSIELTPPVQQSLIHLQEEWQQWVNGFYTTERERFDERLDRILLEVRQLGMRRLPELSRAASTQAVEAARHGDMERATWALQAAERFDPGRPETAFRRAQVARLGGDWSAAATGWVEGYARLFLRSEDWPRVGFGLWIVYGLLLAGALWMAVRMIARGPRLLADLVAFLDRRIPAALTYPVVILLLTWPLLAPPGLFWLLVYWSILLWGYASRSERVVTVLLWLGVAMLPGVVTLARARAELVGSPVHRALGSLSEDRLYGRLFVDLEDVVERFSEERATVHLLADFHRELQQWDAARRYYERLLELEPENATALIGLGAYYFYNNDMGAAVRYFERATEAEPQHVGAWFNLAQAYSESYLFEEMEKALQTAQDLDDGLVSRYQELAEETRIVTFNGGYARIPGLMAQLRRDRLDTTKTPIPWSSLGTVAAWLLLALGLARLGGPGSSRSAPQPLSAGSGLAARALRVLVPGLTSLEERAGGRAFAALALPALLVTLPAVSRLRAPLPPGGGQGELAGLAATGLVLYFGLRLWRDLRRR